MDSNETLAFAQRLMREVWEPFDEGAVPRFYRRDVIGHSGKQRLSYDDVIQRVAADRTHSPDSNYDIGDIVPAEDKWAIRFIFTSASALGQNVAQEVNYFYHLKEGKISEFWVMADVHFDYTAGT